MFILYRIASCSQYFFICTLLISKSRAIHLKDFGLIPLNKDDITLSFYATVENKNDEPFTVGLKMEQCCQFFKEGKPDCESMILHSGLSMELYAKDVRNLTMYYTNLYLRGRKGSCSILLRWKSIDSRRHEPYIRQQFEVHFNTILPEQNFLLEYWQDDPEKYSLCSSVDEDPKNNCMSVNCLIKYSGFRSFYNRTKDLCQKVSLCTEIKTFSEDAESKPRVVLSSMSNRCMDLWSPKTFTESMQLWSSTMNTNAKDYRTYPIKTVCTNGQINMITQHCECQQGWMSKEFPSKTFDPNLSTYSMCDLRDTIGHQVDQVQNATISIYILLTLVVLILITICILIPISIRKYRRRNYEKVSGGRSHEKRILISKAEIENGPNIITEVKNRHETVIHPKTNVPIETEIYLPHPYTSKQTKTHQNLSQNGNPTKHTTVTLDSLSDRADGSLHLNAETRLPPLTSKKFLFPQFSALVNSSLPEPLTPTIVTHSKSKGNEYSMVVEPMSISHVFDDRDRLTIKTKTPSVVKLKLLLKEVDRSTKELAKEISEVTDNTTSQSLDKFSAFNLQTTLSSTSYEFWGNVSDSNTTDENEEYVNESAAKVCQENSTNKHGFWVNKFQQESTG